MALLVIADLGLRLRGLYGTARGAGNGLAERKSRRLPGNVTGVLNAILTDTPRTTRRTALRPP